MRSRAVCSACIVRCKSKGALATQCLLEWSCLGCLSILNDNASRIDANGARAYDYTDFFFVHIKFFYPDRAKPIAL